MPVRTRLTVLFTLGSAVLMAVVSSLFLLGLRTGLTGNLDATLSARTGDVIAALRGDPTAAVSAETGNGIYVQILSATGTVVDASDALGAQALLTAAQARLARSEAVGLDTSVFLAATSPSSTNAGTQDLRVMAVPGPNGLVVAAATSRDTLDNAVGRASWQLLAFGVLLVATAGVGSWLLARAALRPVELMRRQAAQLPLHDAAEGVTVPSTGDEVSRLAVTFNDLLSRLHHALDRERAFVADAGHELRTPLTVLKGELELGRRPGRTRESLLATVEVAAFETERLTRLTEDLLVLARSNEGTAGGWVELDVTALVDTAARALARVAEDRHVRLPTPESGGVWASADPGGLRRAVDNVLVNALRFAPAGTTIDVTVLRRDARAVVAVRDHGPGFPPEFLPVAFERFTQADTTRHRNVGADALHGSGLGLAIVAAIMADHQGTASVHNHVEGGAVVTLSWPAPTPAAGAAAHIIAT